MVSRMPMKGSAHGQRSIEPSSVAVCAVKQIAGAGE
jgi:hypothetical protein